MLSTKAKEALKVALGNKVTGVEVANVIDNQEAKYVDVTISAAAVVTLNATPVTLVTAPGAGKAIIPLSAQLKKPAGTAYANIAAGDDLAFKYTNSSGVTTMTCEMTGFMDQTTQQVRYVENGAAVAFAYVENAPIVAHMLTSEIDTGNSPLIIRLFYKEIAVI